MFDDASVTAFVNARPAVEEQQLPAVEVGPEERKERPPEDRHWDYMPDGTMIVNEDGSLTPAHERGDEAAASEPVDVATAVRRYVAATTAAEKAAAAAVVYEMETFVSFPRRDHVPTQGYPLPGLGLPPALTPRMEKCRRDVVVHDAECERVAMEKAAHRALHMRERLGLVAE